MMRPEDRAEAKLRLTELIERIEAGEVSALLVTSLEGERAGAFALGLGSDLGVCLLAGADCFGSEGYDLILKHLRGLSGSVRVI